jgi:hypothetical protein
MIAFGIVIAVIFLLWLARRAVREWRAEQRRYAEYARRVTLRKG